MHKNIKINSPSKYKYKIYNNSEICKKFSEFVDKF